jgi:hypothetical protein
LKQEILFFAFLVYLERLFCIREHFEHGPARFDKMVVEICELIGENLVRIFILTFGSQDEMTLLS